MSGGRSNSNKLHIVVGGEPDHCNECLWKGHIDGVAKQGRCDVFRDACTIPGNDESPVSFDGEAGHVGVGLGEGFGGFLDTTLARLCCRGVGVVVAGPGGACGGGGGAADLSLVRREAFSRSANLLLWVATFARSAESL